MTSLAPHTTLIELSLPVYNPAAIAKNFDRLAVYRSVDYGVTWAELTNAATRLPISNSQVLYEYADPNGNLTYQYAVAYFNTQTGLQSSLSDPITAQGDQTESVLSIQDLKDIYMAGINQNTPDGQPFKQSMYILALQSAIQWMEDFLDIALVPTIVFREIQDYVKPSGYAQPYTFRTYKAPVESIQRVELTLPGTNPEHPYVYDPTWVTLQNDIGRVTIFPQTGTSAYPIAYGGLASMYATYDLPVLPNALRISYIAGFASGKVPADIKDAIGMLSANRVLDNAGNLIGGAGIASASISLDGLSQSLNTTSSPEFSGYGSTIRVFGEELQQKMPALKRKYRGLLLTAV